jgi:hypothetical protein
MTPTKVVGAMLAPIFIAVALGGAAGITKYGITNSVFCTRTRVYGYPFSSRRSASYKLTSNRYV